MKKTPPLPTFIDIGPYRYTITVSELTRQRAQEVDLIRFLGQTDHDKLEMILDGKQPISLLRETLLHETLHLVTQMCGLYYETGIDKDETLVRRLSPILLEVLRRNPELIKFLTAE